MSDKVKLPKEVAEAIDYLKWQEISNYGIIALSDQITLIGRDYSKEIIDALKVIRKFSFHNTDDDKEGEAGAELLLQALVNGYEVEQTPEDKVREYYEALQEIAKKEIQRQQANSIKTDETLQMKGIIITLNLLGIKIEGVNT